jgi:signal peptide peptidase SppA
MNYPSIIARIFNTPLLIHPQKLDAMIAGIGPRLFGNDQQASAIIAALASGRNLADQQTQPEMFSTRRGERAERGYQVIEGVAVLNTSGALVHRSRFVAADSTVMQGYNDLTADVEDAMSNPDIHAILRVMDTPGGEVQGAFEHHARLLDIKGKKPMIAIADGVAASAGYLSAIAADELAITSTGYAGSIGVVMRHIDLSAALASEGVKVTHIFAGAHKVDGNQFEPLPDAVRADWQAEINSLYEMFVTAAAAALRVDPESLRKTQAQTYRGQAAVDAGLAHRIATTDQLISELAGQRARVFPVGQSARVSATAIQKETSMSGTENPTGQTTAPVITQSDLDKARAEGHAAGIAAESARVSGILALPSAKGNPELAQTCISTGLSLEQSTAILGAAPQPITGVTVAAANPFAAAMAATPNPDVSGIEGNANNDKEAAAAASILSFLR